MTMTDGAFPASRLSRLCQALASAMPALLISYSALIDPLINFDLSQGFVFGGQHLADESKSSALPTKRCCVSNSVLVVPIVQFLL